MKAYYKEWLFDFLEACAAVVFIPGLCLLFFIHWTLFAAVLIAGIVWLTKPEGNV